MVRAVVSDLRGRGNLQGGSTITQQYVKQAYLGSQRTLPRKLKEAVLAVKLAAQVHQEPDPRALPQHHLLRPGRLRRPGRRPGLLRQGRRPAAAARGGPPGRPDPRAGERPTRPGPGASARDRRPTTLKAMVRDHKITDGAARTRPTRPRCPPGQQQAAQLAGGRHQRRQPVLRRLRPPAADPPVRRDGGVLGGGLRVTTTLDPTMQTGLRRRLRPGAASTGSGDPAGALVAIDDQGQVKAMVGGRDYNTSKVNLALGTDGGGTGRQAGSTFKPFLLAETVKEGYSVNSTFPGPGQDRAQRQRGQRARPARSTTSRTRTRRSGGQPDRRHRQVGQHRLRPARDGHRPARTWSTWPSSWASSTPTSSPTPPSCSAPPRCRCSTWPAAYSTFADGGMYIDAAGDRPRSPPPTAPQLPVAAADSGHRC